MAKFWQIAPKAHKIKVRAKKATRAPTYKYTTQA